MKQGLGSCGYIFKLAQFGVKPVTLTTPSLDALSTSPPEAEQFLKVAEYTCEFDRIKVDSCSHHEGTTLGFISDQTETNPFQGSAKECHYCIHT